MTTTLISLISILVGIVSANLYAQFIKKKYFSFTATTIIGVFGSVFVIKTFGRLGVSPNHIIVQQQVNVGLLMTNFAISSLGAIVALKFAKIILLKNI